jgi:hypothetical protein
LEPAPTTEKVENFVGVGSKHTLVL